MKELTLKRTRDLARFGTGLIVAGFAAYLAYMYVTFNALVIGDVKPPLEDTVLVKFNQAAYAQAESRLEARRAAPDHDPAVRHPYGGADGGAALISP